MRSIREVIAEIKSTNARLKLRSRLRWFAQMTIVLAIVAVECFALGRVSMQQEYRERAAHTLAIQDATSSAQIPPGGWVVAARGGKVYDAPWCPKARRLYPEDEVWYASAESAMKAGLVADETCDIYKTTSQK